MKYLHTLDPEELRDMDEDEIRALQEQEYWESVCELEAEDRAMEMYYSTK